MGDERIVKESQRGRECRLEWEKARCESLGCHIQVYHAWIGYEGDVLLLGSVIVARSSVHFFSLIMECKSVIA